MICKKTHFTSKTYMKTIINKYTEKKVKKCRITASITTPRIPRDMAPKWTPIFYDRQTTIRSVCNVIKAIQMQVKNGIPYTATICPLEKLHIKPHHSENITLNNRIVSPNPVENPPKAYAMLCRLAMFTLLH